MDATEIVADHILAKCIEVVACGRDLMMLDGLTLEVTA